MTQFTPRQQNILDFIGQKGEATNQEILVELEKKGDLISRETLVRELNALAERNAIAKTGKGRGVVYKVKSAHPLLVPLDIEKYLAQEVDVRAPKLIPFNFDIFSKLEGIFTPAEIAELHVDRKSVV